jgi:ribose/xylose/arabinose/galactoside ABC-type transport system permease subunit
MPLPSDAPLFLLLIGIHIVVEAISVLAGLGAMLSTTQHGQHPWCGAAYVWSLSGVFVTMAALSLLRWAENVHLFALGSAALSSALLGLTSRRRRWRHRVPTHIVSMSMSFVLLVTAFYVDNGKNLPVWNQLPQIAFWVLPAAIGVPMIIWQLHRNPLTYRP